jgi:mono/diheme cytochrome c family protein
MTGKIHRYRVLMVAVLAMAGACEKAQKPQESALPITPEADAAGMIVLGRQIAETNCGACHAPGPTGDSPRADAPPMRDLLKRYDSDALTEDLIDGVKLGHEDMPAFDFNVAAADALVAYLKALGDGTKN